MKTEIDNIEEMAGVKEYQKKLKFKEKKVKH